MQNFYINPLFSDNYNIKDTIKIQILQKMGIFKHSHFFIMQMIKMVFYQKNSLPLLPINRLLI